MQEVYTNTPKVLIDVNSGNNLVYLPLDRLLSGNAASQSNETVKEEEPHVVQTDKTNQDVVSIPRRTVIRPSYDEMDRTNPDGA
jgi:membrane protease subunit HflK